MVINRSEDVLNGVFVYNKPWDMERCETPFELGDDYESYDWNIVLNDDVEWCYMLNRMDYLEDLVLATLITDNKKYALVAKRLIMSWVSAHRNLVSSNSTRSLDTAIRLRTWSRVLSVLVALDVLDLFELCLVYNSIVAQIKFLYDQWVYEYMVSNWGTIQTCSMLEVFARLGFSEDDEYFTWARTTLNKQLVSQILPDGVNWEMSPMYHIELILFFIGCTKALKDNNLKVPPNIERRICAMTYALSHLTLFKSCIDAVGDSDSQDVKEVIALSSVVLYNAEFKYLANGATPNVFDVLAFGISIIKEYNEMPAFKYASVFFDGTDSGMFSARNNWENDSNTTLFLNGPLGSKHGHADNLHVSCAYKGTPILIDSGRYTYREDGDIRPYLKSTKAHNSLMVDDVSESEPCGGWAFSSFVTPTKSYTKHIRDTHYFEGNVIDKKTFSYMTRRLFFVDIGIWVGFDDVMSQGCHTLNSTFHFNPQLDVVQDEDKIVVDDTLQFLTTCEGNIDKGQCSRVYNKLEQQDVVHCNLQFTDLGKSVWCLCNKDYKIERTHVLLDGKEPVADDICDAFRVYISDDEWYTFAGFHTEIYTGTKAFEIEGIPFNANSVCVHVEGNKKSYMMFRA